MLAQNFKTAPDLCITDAELAALIKVLGMLERGEIAFSRSKRATAGMHVGVPSGFNMRAFYGKADCGTACCICGWAEYIGALEPYSLASKRLSNRSLMRLFEPTTSATIVRISPAEAALALRSYLTTGEANWADVIADL